MGLLTSIFQAIVCCLYWVVSIDCFCTEEQPSVGASERLVLKLTEALKAGECSLYDSKLWPEDYGEQVVRENGVKEVFDFVVVGAGSAGSVVASRLTENSNIKVLVIEAGGDPPKESEMALMFSLLRTKYTWNDYSIPRANCCLSMINETCYWARGKMIGGGGGANGNIFLTGTRENYDGWEKLGNPGWSWADVNKYFTKGQERRGNDSHPVGGLILNYIKQVPENQPLNDLIYQAARQVGLPVVDNFNEAAHIGITTNVLTTTENGRRMSTGKTYLAKVAKKRSNLKIIKKAYVSRILYTDINQVSGVEFLIDGKFKYSVNASKEVILSAGALSSPKILIHSGIGPKDQLQSLGIPVRKILQVGENLQDHGILPFFFRINRGNITTFDERSEFQNIFNYFLYNEGPLFSVGSLCGYINSDPRSKSRYPDMQILTPFIAPSDDRSIETNFGLDRNIYQIIQSAIGQQNMLVVYTSLMKPQTSGRITVSSTNVFDAPIIDYEYGKHDADKAAVVRFARYMQRIQNTKAFRKYDIQLVLPPFPKCAGLTTNSDAYWRCYAQYLLIGSWHPTGTCKMGPKSDLDAVVDERLRVHGVQGVRVIDASIMPNITSGNTNAPAILIGEKGAAMVSEDWDI